MDKGKTLWETRAKRLGDSFVSVMEQSFPPVVNEAIHNIHLREIFQVIPSGARRILDIGCGWGRVASVISARHRVLVNGIDVSAHFVSLFNKRLKRKGRAVVGDMRMLPYPDHTFDVVYCFVSLMYLSSPAGQEKAIIEMLRVLAHDGTLLLIEPNTIGVRFVRLGGIVPFVYRTFLGKPKVETYGTAFRMKDIQTLIHKAHGRIIRTKGYPFLTLFLLPTVFIGKMFPAVAKVILSGCSVLDRIFPSPALSYFTTWIIRYEAVGQR